MRYVQKLSLYFSGGALQPLSCTMTHSTLEITPFVCGLKPHSSSYTTCNKNAYQIQKYKKNSELDRGRSERLTTLSPSVSRFSRQCGIRSISQPYKFSMACYGDRFNFLYVDDIRISQELHLWSSTDCYCDSFTFLYVDDVRFEVFTAMTTKNCVFLDVTQ
jgi:hypothetical protein